MLPVNGEIVVDPNNPSWLMYNNGAQFFMCGPGDPEGFLYRGTLNPDGTRNGDQLALINTLASTGANSIYLMSVRSNGGDGGPTQNPWINDNPSNGLNNAILDQWETWFTEMDNNGIVIFFFFYDDSADPFGGINMGVGEQQFVKDIVNRFRHHKNLIWVIAEDSQEALSISRISQIAAEIKANDPIHPVANHQLSGLTFNHVDDPNLDQFAIQYNPIPLSPQKLHDGMVTAWNNAAGRYNLRHGCAILPGHPRSTR